MLNRIKDFIFEKDETPNADVTTVTDSGFVGAHYVSNDAICEDPAAHGFYCPECKTGFKTKAATSVHKRYKHGK